MSGDEVCGKARQGCEVAPVDGGDKCRFDRAGVFCVQLFGKFEFFLNSRKFRWLIIEWGFRF